MLLSQNLLIMQKTLLLTLFVLSSLSACFAQDSHTRGMFSIGIERSFITHDYDSYLMSDLFKNGIGGSIKMDLPVYPNIYFTVAGGFSTFQATDQIKAYVNQIPLYQHPTSESFEQVKIGLKCYIIKSLFLEVQAGGVFRSDKTVEFMVRSRVSAVYSAGIGYLFHNGMNWAHGTKYGN